MLLMCACVYSVVSEFYLCEVGGIVCWKGSVCLLLDVGFAGWGSVDGIVTRYGFDGPRIELRWGRIFLSRPDRP